LTLGEQLGATPFHFELIRLIGEVEHSIVNLTRGDHPTAWVGVYLRLVLSCFMPYADADAVVAAAMPSKRGRLFDA
jgi:hypothetical protein